MTTRLNWPQSRFTESLFVQCIFFYVSSDRILKHIGLILTTKPNFTLLLCPQQPNFTPFRCPRHLLNEYILPAMPAPLEQLSGTPKWSKIWLSGTPKQSIIWLSGKLKWIKNWMLGQPNGVKCQTWKNIIYFLNVIQIFVKHFPTNSNVNWTYGPYIENCDIRPFNTDQELFWLLLNPLFDCFQSLW